MSRQDEEQMPNGDDVLAAEYVLGVQAAELRTELKERISTDSAFASLVEEWENRLSDLNAEYGEAEPPAWLKQAVQKRLFDSDGDQRAGWWQSLGLWRGLTFAGLALSLGLFLTTMNPSVPTTAPDPIVVAMQAEGGDVRFMAYYEPGANEIRVSTIRADKPTDRDFELWLIEEDGVPQSIGVIQDGQKSSVSVSPELLRRINAGDTFAVSVEPLGGSPTGAVTGPVIAAGVSQDV